MDLDEFFWTTQVLEQGADDNILVVIQNTVWNLCCVSDPILPLRSLIFLVFQWFDFPACTVISAASMWTLRTL